MRYELLYDLDQWLLTGALLAVLLVAEEAGFRVGRWRRAGYDDDARSNYGNLQAGLFGLMGLLLAFTFAMAQQRYEMRKDVVVDEANAIGTAWLRADLVAEPVRGEIKALLASYVDQRRVPPSPSADRLRAAIAESERLQGEVWALAVRAARAEPGPASALLVAAVNEVIDVHGKRIASGRNHVPQVVILLVLVFALAAAALTGYRCGVGPRRYRLPSVAFLAMVTLMIAVIVDLDRPHRGLITIDQAALFDLRATIRAAR